VTVRGSRSPPGLWRLLVPALLAWAVAAIAVTQPGLAAGVARCMTGLAVVLLLVCLAARISRVGDTQMMHRALVIVPLLAVTCAIVMLVTMRIASVEQVRADPALLHAAAIGETTQFQAMLTAYPSVRERAHGTNAWVRADIQSQSGSVPVLLWLPEPDAVPRTWAPGLHTEVIGRLTAQPPGDSAAYTVRVLEIDEANGQPVEASIGALAAHLRHALTDRAARVSGAELVPGFAVGDTSLVTETLDQAMLESSLSHLVAVSGSNTGLVIAAMVWLSSWLGAGKRLRIVVAAAGLACFVLVVGPDISVQRATVMASVMLVSGFGGKRSLAMPALGLAVIVLLLLNPWQSLQPGFALSVAATGGILIVATPLSRWLRRQVRVPQPVALAVAVAAAAQLACSPLLLLLEPGIPVIGVLANVVAAPAAPLGTGLGLIAALLAPVSSTLSHAVVLLASIPARWVATTAHVSADVPLGRWAWPGGWPGAIVFTACITALVLAWWLQRGKIGVPGIVRPAPRQPWHAPNQRPAALSITVVVLTSGALMTILTIVVVHPLVQKLLIPQGWSVVACDVGQGDALLLRDPDLPEQVMLVDTGDDPKKLRECLEMFGVGRVSLLVLSHDDRDHVGALDAVIDRVDAALVSVSPRGASDAERNPLQQLLAAEVPVVLAHEGMHREGAEGLQWRVLAPRHGSVPQSTNAASVVMTVQAGPTRVLLLGDTGETEQDALLRSGAPVGAQVLKVAHHGSRDQSIQLPAAVAAEWALISVGATNHYGHPAPDTLEGLVRSGAKVIRTDLHGSIALIPELDGQLRPWVQHSTSRSLG
jgi:competence protein ComEC